MRRIAIVMMCLCGLVLAQGTYTGGATWIGGGIWGASFQSSPQYSDLPLPDFTPQGGVPLSLPQLWVDPLEAFAQAIDNTVYIGNTSNGCPTAAARTNYLGQAKPAGQCDYYDANGSGIQAVTNDWCALSGGGYDQRWDVVITHGTTYNLGSGSWIWCTKYNGTAASKYLVFHTDCSASSPCSGTNDLSYNPDGRQVCSHGINDVLSPALPSVGQRNHGCAGYLGLPGVDAPVPITNASYNYDANYNDVANMFTITTTSATSVITMAAASTQGGPNRCDGQGGSGTSACPVQGVNHIILADAHITTNTSGTQQFSLANFSANEWDSPYPADQTSDYAGAIANHVGMTRFYLDGTADDDGYGVPHTVNGIKFACSNCFLTHGYMDGVKADGSESHVITLNDGYGPILLSNLWIEGGSIGLWGGGGGNPSIRGGVTSDVEARRLRVTYNPRWYPQPAGNQAATKKITGGSCTGGTSLDLTIPNSNNTISNLVVYLSKIKGSDGATVAADGWYTATSLNSTDVVIGVACSETPSTGTVYGFANNYLGPVNISASAMAAAGKDPTVNSTPSEKDRIESKTWQRVLLDGLIDENAAVEGQQGQVLGNSLRAYSNVAYDSGNETAVIQDFTITNAILRNSTEGALLSSRSGSGSWVQFTISNVTCTGTTQAAVTATAAGGGSMNSKMYNAPNYLLDLRRNCSSSGSFPCTNPSIGADVYLSGVGGGLIPDGWYTTAYPNGGDYSNAGTSVTVLADPNGVGNVCTTAGGTASTGTIYAISQGAGHGTSWSMHRMMYQNVLMYGVGDHNKWNGANTATAFQAAASGNNFTVQVTVNPDNTTATATVLANDNCPGSEQCPSVIQALAGDLAYVRCLADDRFSSGPVNSKGVPILSVASNQLSFTYTPQNGSPALAAGDTTTCPLETPLDTNAGTQTGFYNNQSFPWPFYVNHVTAVGVNGMDVTLGQTPEFHRYGTFLNSFLLVPGTSDLAPNNSCSNCKYGFVANNSEPYSGSDLHGVTAGNDRNTLTMKSWALSTRDIHNYLLFPCGSPGSNGCQTGGDPGAYPGTNSTPANVATGGASVTCNGGAACDATHYTPDSVGFLGAMNMTAYPFAMSDWRNYALHSSSPYKSGGILQATDGLDNGAQIGMLANALARTLYVCDPSRGNICGTSGPHRDGPQYGFLQWSAYPGAQNYRVYRDGGSSPVATVTTTWFNDYGLPAGGHTWTVKAWDGTAEHIVAGLNTQIF